MTLQLFVTKTGSSPLGPKLISISNLLSHNTNTSFNPFAMPLNSGSMIAKATTFCFFFLLLQVAKFHPTNEVPRCGFPVKNIPCLICINVSFNVQVIASCTIILGYLFGLRSFNIIQTYIPVIKIQLR